MDSLNGQIFSLDEVIISANKTEESKKQIAQQIQLLKMKELEILQYKSTADLIAGSGNVFVQKSQSGGGSPVIRGFEANRILLVIDGVRMNNLIYRAGHLQNIITIDPSILDRAEILFGPSSTIYGSDALGGVIHLITRKPRLAREEEGVNVGLNVFNGYGSADNHINSHFDLNLGGKKFGSLTSFTYSRFGDLKSGRNRNPFYDGEVGIRRIYQERVNGKDSVIQNDKPYLQVKSGYTQYDFLQKFIFIPSGTTSHGVNIQYSGSTDVPRYDRLTDPDGSGLRYAEWYYGPQVRLLVSYELKKYFSATSFFNSMDVNLNYQRIQESRHTRRFNSDNLQHRNEDVQVAGINIDAQRLSGNHRLHVGFDGQFNTLKSTAELENIVTGGKSGLDTRYPDGDNSLVSAAIFVSHSWKITETLSFTDGLRLGYEKLHATFVDTSFFQFPFRKTEQNNPVYSGSAGLIKLPGKNWKLTMLLSTGFRVPNIDDLAKIFESEPGNVIVPNPDLKPEKTINGEIGISKQLGKSSGFETSVFYTKFYDAIVTNNYTYNGQDSILYNGTMSKVLASQNQQEAYLYGISASVKSKIAGHLLLNFNMNYTYGRIKTDSVDYPLDHIPPLLLRLNAAYTYKNFETGFSVTYNGWKRIKDYYLNGEDNEQYATAKGTPAWINFNIKFAYVASKQWTVQAGVDNIFDTQYRAFASGINAPGRNISAGLRFSY